MITNEVWKRVEGYTRYEVSNYGRVRNFFTKEQKALRKTKTGYMITDLKENGSKKTAYVHRLVAQAFIPNPNNKPQINHKDENKDNNFVSNLEWCTIEYNNQYGNHINNIRKTQAEKVGKKVAQIDVKTNKIINIFDTLSEASKFVGAKKQAINWAIQKNTHTCAGFRWVVME